MKAMAKIHPFFAAHNVSPGGGWHRQGADYYGYVTGLPSLETAALTRQMVVSYKRAR